MIKLKPLIRFGAIITIGLLPIASCSKHKEPVKVQAAATYDSATKLTIALTNIADQKPVGAVYTSTDLAQARARIGGTLVRLLVDEGSMVSQGQLIGVIDEARFGAEIAAGQANAAAAASQANATEATARGAPAQVAAAMAMAQKAQADYNRTKTLFDQGVYAQARLDQMRAAMSVANSQVAIAQSGVAAANANTNAARAQANSAQASAQIARHMRNQGQILAPRSGRVLMTPLPQGSVVMPGELVATIAAGAQILRLLAPEGDAKGLNVGQSLNIIGNNNEIISTSKITKIYPAIENGQVKIDIATDGQDHLVGERAEVLLPIGAREAIIIPANYLITRQGVDFVRLVRGQNALEIPVQRGTIQTGGVEILTGLSAGDIIVLPNSRPATTPKVKH